VQIVKPSVELIYITPDALQIIERAGRVCYKSEEKITAGTATEFVRKILRMGHTSVIEHAVASMRFICDRGVTHEMVRHRLASYSQESTRYCNYAKDKFGSEITVIEPAFDNDEQRAEWVAAMEASERCYLNLLEKNASPQMARSVLPNSLKTEIVMTANLREWRHFFALRCDGAAHPQMREVADMAREILAAEIPEVFA
jgi:thymidylate synthase (FAD)